MPEDQLPEDVVPTLVPHGPDGMHREGVAITDSPGQELPQLLLCDILPRLAVDLHESVPHHAILLVELLGEVVVETLRAVANRPGIAGGKHDLLGQLVGRGVREAVLGRLRDEALRLRLFEHVQPSCVPRGVAGVLQDLADPVERPPRQCYLLGGQRLAILHATAPHGEGVEVRHHRLHAGLGVCDEQAMRVHRVRIVHLEEHHLGLAGLQHRV
mmetsp:Transcript_43503/g.125736  ORF Transcript_43503/g.125736 Transcript_43503/m.125736 type:complete len:214 (-) Transcript_43503:1659-2300(-)